MDSEEVELGWDKGATRQRFLEASLDYGYGDEETFSAALCREYPSLRDTTYLDHAASPPAPLSTLTALSSSLSSTLFSNPHSRSHSSTTTTAAIDTVRDRILDELFGLSTAAARRDWDVVFTSGATAVLKLVAEAYPWRRSSRFRYLRESHTSLVGVRGVALEKGAKVDAMEVEDAESLREDEWETMFAYSAQCNATGVRLGLGLGQRLKQRHPNSVLLLDAASYLATNVLDLSSLPLDAAPDFIACSFYKLFGYPTGLGALIVKRGSGSLLQRNGYFGGGTVDALSVSSPFWTHPRHSSPTNSAFPPIHSQFEDGTLAFLNIIALGHALDTTQRLYKSLSHISAHVASLTTLATHELARLRHSNGQRVVQQHRAFRGASIVESPGPIIGFTLLDISGNPVGHIHLDRMATINGFQLRTGGLCNTGVLSSAVGITDADLKDGYSQGRVCWDDEEFGGADGARKPLGIARISFGACSTVDDVLDFIGFLRRFFVDEVTPSTSSSSLPRTSTVVSARLESLMLYPIKSCGGQSVAEWEITHTGLAYDREWLLIDSNSGNALSQKRYPRMALIKPSIDLSSNVLRITAPHQPDLVLPLERLASPATADARVCSEAISVSSTFPAADAWFSSFLDVDCVLSRVAEGASRQGHFDRSPHPVPILLSNESPFLLISRSSVDQGDSWISSDPPPDRRSAIPTLPIHPSCFRGNFLISALDDLPLPPFHEDTVERIEIGSESFHVLAPCRRCLMVCVDQETGERVRSNEPFNTLARKRRSAKGRIEFGVHLLWRGSEEGRVRVSDVVRLVSK